MEFRPNNSQDAISRASQSLRLLGIVSALFGFAVIVAGGYGNRYERFRLFFTGLGAVVWFVPGVLEIACAKMIEARRRFAAMVGMLVASMQLASAVVIFIMQLHYSPISPVPLVLSVLWVIALVRVIGELHSASAFVNTEAQLMRGFEPTVPAIPVDQTDDKLT